VTPGRAALGRLLRWAYWTTSLLLFPLVNAAIVPPTGASGWAGFGIGAGVGAVMFGVEQLFGQRMADRVYAEFAAVAREWGVLSGRITETTEEQR
jgi:hypothetical protein